jgi:hypothetical protein
VISKEKNLIPKDEGKQCLRFENIPQVLEKLIKMSTF